MRVPHIAIRVPHVVAGIGVPHIVAGVIAAGLLAVAGAAALQQRPGPSVASPPLARSADAQNAAPTAAWRRDPSASVGPTASSSATVSGAAVASPKLQDQLAPAAPTSSNEQKVALAINSTGSVAITARSTATINVRSGPGQQFGILALIGADTPVTVKGCIEAATWCSVDAGSTQGWASSQYLATNITGPRLIIGDRA